MKEFKVFLEYDVANLSGKGKFLNRLAKQWSKTGVECSMDPRGCNARLAVTRFRSESKLPTVIRIDGAHNEVHSNDKSKIKHMVKSMIWKNKETANSITKSRAVVFQSDFCKRMGHVVFKAKWPREYTIFNGADPSEFLPRNPQKSVLLFAHWKMRPHKRLKEMVDVAHAYSKMHPEVVFNVLGGFEETYEKTPNLVFHGRCDADRIARFLSEAGCMLNICYADWCPNAVVEALVAGVPVICTANHGVSEIVKDSGIIVDIDEPIPQKHFVRAMNKPIRNIQPVYDALDKIMFGGATFPKAEHLYIENVAKQYEGVFRDILG